MSHEEFFVEIQQPNESPSLLCDRLVPAAMDVGTETTKIAYVTKATAGDDSHKNYRLHFALFETTNLEAALDFLKAKLAEVKPQKPVNETAMKLRATGLGVSVHLAKIKEKLGFDLEYIDHSISLCRGLSFLIRSSSHENVCHPPVVLDESEYAGIDRGEMFERFRQSQMEMIAGQSAENPFPCFLFDFGSTASLYEIQEDGSWELKYKNELAGKSFEGLCQLLVGTSKYPEILQLASVGKRGNVDTQVRDVLNESQQDKESVKKSPYGAMPPSMPLFTFGKAADFDKTLEESRKEDVAQSLLSAITANLYYPVSQFACFCKIRHIYMSGNFYQHEFARSEVLRSTKLFGAMDGLKLHFLKVNQMAALGALLVA